MENEKKEMLQNLENEIKTYCEQIAYLEDMYELQRELTPLEIPNEHLVGIKIINSALYDASFIIIAKLVTDKDKQTKSIWKLMEKIRKNSYLYEDEKKEELLNLTKKYEKILSEELGSIINKIKNRRDTLIAHNDKKYFGKMEKYTERIPNYELWRVSNEVKKYLCSIVEILKIPASTVGEYIQCKDLKKLIDGGIFAI